MNTFYIVFPTKEDKIEDIFIDRKSGENLIKEMFMVIDRIDCEKNTKIFINRLNKQSFIDDFKVLEELLSVSVKIGRYEVEEMVNNLITNNDIKFSRPDTPFDQKILIINNFNEIDLFFKIINESRILNREDYRHCENHPKYDPNKSPLIGGTEGFNNAEQLLSSAIGDSKTRRDILINIDINNQNFIIRFEDENFNNQYHTYHIVKKENGQYIADLNNITLIKSKNKGIRRAFDLIQYRNR